MGMRKIAVEEFLGVFREGRERFSTFRELDFSCGRLGNNQLELGKLFRHLDAEKDNMGYSSRAWAWRAMQHVEALVGLEIWMGYS